MQAKTHILARHPTLPLRTTALVLRLTWNAANQDWRVLVKPADGSKARVFADLESALVYIAGTYAAQR